MHDVIKAQQRNGLDPGMVDENGNFRLRKDILNDNGYRS